MAQLLGTICRSAKRCFPGTTVMRGVPMARASLAGIDTHNWSMMAVHAADVRGCAAVPYRDAMHATDPTDDKQATDNLNDQLGDDIDRSEVLDASGYCPTNEHFVNALRAKREPQLAQLSDRWHRMRVAWLVTGSMAITEYKPQRSHDAQSLPLANSKSYCSQQEVSSTGRVDAGDLSDGDIEDLLRALDKMKANKRKRRVRVNVASIKKVLRDPERNETISFTRPLPLPQMVELLAEHWDEDSAAVL